MEQIYFIFIKILKSFIFRIFSNSILLIMFKKPFFIFSIIFFGTICAQKTQNVDPIPYPNMRIQNKVQSQPSLFKRTVFTKELSTVGGKASEPLFIINEKIASSAEFRKLDPNNIKV